MFLALADEVLQSDLELSLHQQRQLPVGVLEIFHHEVLNKKEIDSYE